MRACMCVCMCNYSGPVRIYFKLTRILIYECVATTIWRFRRRGDYRYYKCSKNTYLCVKTRLGYWPDFSTFFFHVYSEIQIGDSCKVNKVRRDALLTVIMRYVNEIHDYAPLTVPAYEPRIVMHLSRHFTTYRHGRL